MSEGGTVERVVLFRRIWWKRLTSPIVRSIICCKNVLLGPLLCRRIEGYQGATGAQVSALNGAPQMNLEVSYSAGSLSSGRRASTHVLSSSIPMNSSTWEGPRVLDATTGA